MKGKPNTSPLSFPIASERTDKNNKLEMSGENKVWTPEQGRAFLELRQQQINNEQNREKRYEELNQNRRNRQYSRRKTIR